MKKTFLVGYYGMKNSGDDALLAATVWGARTVLKHHSFIINSPLELKVSGINSVGPILVPEQTYPAQNRMKQYRAAFDSNCIIFGGGSVLRNNRDIDLKRDLMLLSKGQQHLALGLGIGPFEDVKAEKSCKHFLNNCMFVGVRDPLSLQIAQSIAPNANVQLTFDLAPLLLKMESFNLKPLPRKGIAVCLCPKERLNGNKYGERRRLQQIANTLNTTYFFTGEPVHFINLNGHLSLGDKDVHREVAALLDNKVKFSFIEYDANPFRVIQRMASYKAIISMRLHGGIFGFLTGTPVISIAYDQKCNAWCDQIGMPASLRFDANQVDSSLITHQLCMGLADKFEPNKLSIKNAINAAMTNWSLLYEHIKNKNFSHYSTI